MIKMMRLRFLFLMLIALSSFTLNLQAQGSTPPFYYQFLAGSAEYCGTGTIRFFGYSYGYQSSTQWAVHGILPNYNIPDGFLIYTWTLTDEVGTLAEGGFNSMTGVSTGGTYGGSIDFNVYRFPVGEVDFRANGTVRGTGSTGSPCTQSFDATTYTTIGGGGSSDLRTNSVNNYKFQNRQSNLFLDLPDASDYTSAIQDEPGSGNQFWTLSEIPSNGKFNITNDTTLKPLYADFNSGSSLVYQLPGTERGWRFVSVGDGTSFYIVYRYNNRLTDPQYAMEPIGGTIKPGKPITAVPRANRLSQKWRITNF